MKSAGQKFALAMLSAGFGLFLAGCGGTELPAPKKTTPTEKPAPSEKPKSEEAKTDQPKSDHPKAEHPSSEHPK